MREEMRVPTKIDPDGFVDGRFIGRTRLAELIVTQIDPGLRRALSGAHAAGLRDAALYEGSGTKGSRGLYPGAHAAGLYDAALF